MIPRRFQLKAPGPENGGQVTGLLTIYSAPKPSDLPGLSVALVVEDGGRGEPGPEKVSGQLDAYPS